MENRILKFRAWDNKNKFMCGAEYGDWISFDGVPYTECSRRYDTPNTEIEKAKDYHIMQFTGLLDKNGKEIYEGDILKVGENLTCEIIYIDANDESYGDETHAAFHAKVYGRNKIIPIDSYFKNNCKIIGNIFQNQELITNQPQ